MPSRPAGRPSISDEDDRLALAPQGLGAVAEVARAALRARRSSDRLPTTTARPSTWPSTPFPVCDWNDSAGGSCKSRVPGQPGDRRGQRMLAGQFEAGGQPQQLGFVLARRRHDRDHPRLALGQRAGLVDDQRIDPLQDLERLGVLDQHAGGGAAAGADHDRHRRRQPQRARAGDDQHRDGVDQGVGQARLRAEASPRRRR